MAAKVVDASAIAAIIFGEPEAESVAVHLGDSPLVAPALFRFEVANICWKKLRRYPDKRELLIESFGWLDHFDVQEAEVVMPQVILLAEREGLTAYDASYLWLALEFDADLVTLDRPLREAFEKVSESLPSRP
jgi:predicted nucleic acid-binding protein